MKKTLIVGVGNTIMGDDGLGVRTLESLRSLGLPAHVDVLEAGTALLDALPDLQEYEKVILLDAVESDNDDVSIVRNPFSSGTFQRGFSLHDVGVGEAFSLILLEKGSLPEIVIMGVSPKQIEFGTELSSSVESRIPNLVEAVLKEINCERSLDLCMAK